MSIKIPRGLGFLHPDFMELADYIGPGFRLDWCHSDDSKGHEEANDPRYHDNVDFMRSTDLFCYQNIALMVQGIHRPYVAKIMEMTGDMGAVSFLEVGAGGGQLGLALHTLGFQVSFADIYSRSLLWLAWRLRKRGLDLPVYPLEEGWEQIPHHQMASAFDVIEHLGPDVQRDLLDNLGAKSDVTLVNLIREDAELDGLHLPVDFDALTDYCREHWPTAAYDLYPDANGNIRQRLVVFGRGLIIEPD